MLLLGPSASCLAYQVSLRDFLVSSPILPSRFIIVTALSTTSLLVSAATISLFDLASVGISIVEHLIIQLVLAGIQTNQYRLDVVLSFLADFLRWELLE